MAHARRKFVELHLNQKSTIAARALDFIGQLYGIEREVKAMEPEERLQERLTRAVPVAMTLHVWLPQRTRITPGTATARTIDYSLKRWVALTRYLDDPALPIDNNFDDQQIRPWATGRKSWLLAGTLMAGQRAAAIMSLIQSAKLNGHEPYAYIRDRRRAHTRRSRAPWPYFRLSESKLAWPGDVRIPNGCLHRLRLATYRGLLGRRISAGNAKFLQEPFWHGNKQDQRAYAQNPCKYVDADIYAACRCLSKA